MKEKRKHIENISVNGQDFLLEQLVQEKNFAAYFHMLNCLKEELLLLIAVKDTPGFGLRENEKDSLNRMGLTQQFEEKHWHSYIAVVNCGKVVIEKLSVNDEDLEESITLKKHRIRLFSSVYKKANTAEIIIDDIDYAVNSRGFNIVIFDWNKETVVDSVCFNKLVQHHCTVRKEDMLLARIDCLETEIRSMKEYLSEFKSLFLGQMESTQLMLWQCYRKEGESLDAAKERFFLSLPKASGEMRDLQLAGLILLIRFDKVCRKNNIQYWLSFGGLLGAVRHHNCIPWDDDLDVGMMRDEYEKVKAAFADDKDFACKEMVCVSSGTLNLCYQLHYRAYDVEVCLDIFLYDYATEINEAVVQKQVELNIEMTSEGRKIAKALGLDPSKEDILFEYASAPPEFVQYFENFKRRAVECYGRSKENALGMIWSIDNFIYIPAVKTNKNLDEVFPLCEVELEGHMFLAPHNAVKYAGDIFGDVFSVPDDMSTHRHFKQNERQRKNLEEILEKYKYILEE